MPAKKKGKPRGRPFPPNNRMNPAGRPPGRSGKNEWAEACQRGLTRELADKWFARFSASVTNGSLKALSIITKALPAPDDLIRVTIPKIGCADDAAKALAAVCESVASGEIGLAQAEAMSAIIARTGEAYSKSADIAALLAQVEALRRVAQERDAAQSAAPNDGPRLPWERAPSEPTGPSDPGEP